MSGKPRPGGATGGGASKTPGRKGAGAARRIAPAMPTGKLDISYLLNDEDMPARRPGGPSRPKVNAPLPCQYCPLKFDSKHSLTKHINSYHKGPSRMGKGPHKCTECNTSFGEKGNLNRHIRSVHRGEKPWSCDQCSLAFPFRDTLTRHVRAVHEHQRPFQCQHCQSKFKKRDHLSRHLKSQHGVYG